MKPVKPPRINGRVPVLSAQEAVNYIPDEATLWEGANKSLI